MTERYYSNDAELAEFLRREDGNAFEQVYEQYYRMAASFIHKNSGSEDDAADIFQEMLFILVKKLQDKEFKLTAKLGTYIYSVVRNLWLARLKKRRIAKVALQDDMEEFIILDESELEVKIEHEKKHELMAQVLETLKEDCREVIMAFFYKNLSHRSIAELKGYTVAFARVKLHRCMKSFRKKVRQHPDFQSF